jgi:hypothetical protein
MIKLYKNISEKLHYWEAWIEEGNKCVVEHWGVVGERGEFINHPLPKKYKEAELLRFILAKALDDSYEPFDDDDLETLVVEYLLDGFGTSTDLDKRNRLDDRLNETLGWTGVGHVDGGSIGSGSMELACCVVNFEIAKKVIEDDLKLTDFSDFSRIYSE